MAKHSAATGTRPPRGAELPEGAFRDRTRPPKEIELLRKLGPAMTWWSELREHVAHLAGHIRAEWAFAFAKSGWTLRLYDRERVLLYLIPQDGGFLVGIVLGQRALEKATAINPTGFLPTVLNQAVRNPEGVGVRFPVLSAEACRIAKQLAGIKLET